MSLKHSVRKFVLAGSIVIGLALVLAVGGRWTRRDGMPSLTCRPVRLQERVPSGGRTWSEKKYPEQYATENRAETHLSPVEGVDTEDFLQRQRFMDVAGRAFSRDFSSRFSYEPGNEWSPKVRLSWLRRAETFVGRLEASGLKPNFAYQIKLRGDFNQRKAFERIGYLGRWRLPGGGTNFTDEEFEAYPDKNEVRSYLFFDFFVTDARGNVTKEFYLDSSLHVLYNATWQGWPGGDDTRPIVIVPGRTASEIYARPVAAVEPQEIYAESEADSPSGTRRPPVGRAFLPAGSYRVEFVLTEESFHGFGDAGYWATVMSAPVEFEIIDRPKPPAGPWKSLVPARKLSLKGVQTHGIEVTEQTPEMLRGRATDEGAGLVFEETFNVPEGQRYVLRMDMVVEDPQTAQIIVDNGGGFDSGIRYYADSAGCGRWRGFEVELTHSICGQSSRVWLAPRLDEGPVAVRNVTLCRVE
jgi:hypothetical protein